MQNFVILSGSFSASGNFSGYSRKALEFGDKSGRIFIAKRQMDSLGWSKIEEVKFPFLVTATEREYNELDADRNPTGNKFARLTAFSLYKTQDELNAAEVAEAMIDVSAKQAVKAAATAAGLTTEDVNSLMNAAI